MRIGINALSVNNRSGTGYYTQQLILSLSEIDRENEYLLFLPERCLLTNPSRYDHPPDEESRDFGRRLRPVLNQAKNFQPYMVSRRSRLGRIAWENYYLPRETRHLNLDLLHSPTGIAPARPGCATVVTLHDLAFWRYPELFHWTHRAYLHRVLPKSARQAAAVITDSSGVREEIIAELGIAPSTVFPIPLGVSTDFKPIDDPEYLAQVRQRYRLPERFILALGTVEPRKNLLNLLEAFRLILQEEPELTLVLVGRKGWKEEPVFEKIASLGLDNKILWTGFLPRNDLPAIYSLATVCAYLSVYEGFGLPVLEAMASGTPVVVSDIPVFQEWAAEAAILVNPQDPSRIAQEILRVATHSDLHQKAREAGLEKAKYYTWKRTAEATLEVYRKVNQIKS